MRIALLEDQPDQGRLLQSWLEDEGHSCMWYTTGEELLRGIRRDSYDVLILDWELPGASGIETLTQLRSDMSWPIPVLFVTNRDHEEDIVTALKAGADDYMIKPVRRMELLARIDAVQRRAEALPDDKDIVEFAPYRFDRANRTVNVNGDAIQLTAKEFELAVFLFQNAGRLFSRGHILERVWGQRADLNTRTVDTHMSLVRQKLRLGPQHNWRLATIYRHGYRLEKLQSD